MAHEGFVDLEALVGGEPEAAGVGVAGAVNEPDRDPFALQHFDDGNEIAVTGNQRNVRDGLAAGHLCCVESE